MIKNYILSLLHDMHQNKFTLSSLDETINMSDSCHILSGNVLKLNLHRRLEAISLNLLILYDSSIDVSKNKVT